MLGIKFSRKTVDPVIEAELAEAARIRLEARVKSLGSSQHAATCRTLRGHERAEHRECVYRVGSAMFDQVTSVSCRIADKSFSGLKVVFNSDVDCPDEFALTIPTLRFVGIVKKAWQNGREAGVSVVRWNDAV